MTVLTRFEPFREFTTLQDRINRVFREARRRPRRCPDHVQLRPRR